MEDCEPSEGPVRQPTTREFVQQLRAVLAQGPPHFEVRSREHPPPHLVVRRRYSIMSCIFTNSSLIFLPLSRCFIYRSTMTQKVQTVTVNPKINQKILVAGISVG